MSNPYWSGSGGIGQSGLEERDIVESYWMRVNSYIVKAVDFQQFTDAARDLGLYWTLLNELQMPAQR